MKRWKIMAALLLLMSGCTASPQNNTEPVPEPVDMTALTALADQQAEMLVSQLGAVSVQYALMDNGEIIVSGQKGVFAKDSDQPLSADNQYAIGSVSKVFTAAAILKLEEQGKLTLDQSVADILPEFEMADERYRQITVRMLLNHSSGLPGSTYADGFTFTPVSTAHDTFLEVLKEARLQADPGAYSVYSNDGFLLAELVAEKVSGQSFTDYIKTTFTEPLGMIRTQTPAETVNFNQMPAIYSSTQPQRKLPADVMNAYGTGGIYSSAEDLCRFGQMFMSDSALLSETSLAAMMTNEAKKGVWPDAEVNSIDYGLGWDSVEVYPFANSGFQALTKGGDTLYSHASFTVLPKEGLTCAVLSSGGLSTYNQMMANQLLEQALIDKGLTDGLKRVQLPEEPKTSTPIDDGIRQYAGLYADSTSLYTISFNEDGSMNFISELAPDQITVLKHLGEGRFLLPSPMVNQMFSFAENDGKTYLKVEAVSEIPGMGSSATTVYYAMKVEKNPLSAETASAWQNRSGKSYFLLSETASSQIYEMMLPVAPIMISAMDAGYVNAHQITDASTARAVVQIPGTGSRDQFDYEFYTEESIEYMKAGGALYVSQDALIPLNEGDMEITLNDQGHTRWLLIDPALKGKTLTITQSSGAAFVYDSAMICLADTFVDGVQTIVLPEGGYLGIASDPSMTVQLNVK